MHHRIGIVFLVLLAIPGAARAQNFSGNYRLQDPQGSTTMVVQQDGAGKVTGTLTLDDGTAVNLQGDIKGAEVVGIAEMGGKNSLFKLQFQGEQLVYTMIAVTADGKPDLANAQQFPFVRTGGGAGPGGFPPAAGQNPLAGNPLGDLMVGVFSDGNMRVELAGGDGRYQGNIQFKGATFPVTAQSPDGTSLQGTFTRGADRFDFSGSLQGTTLTFTTGGTTYQLRKQASSGGGLMGGGRNPASKPAGGAKAIPAAGNPAAAQPIAGGQTVSDPSLGVRFSVPAGWKYQKRQAVYVIGHDTTPGMVLIMPHQSNSLQELAQAASEPLYQAEDGQLMVSSQPETLASNMLAAEYGGTVQGKNARGRIVGVISPHGGGFLVMAGTDAGSYGPQYAQLAEAVARSMSFSKPQAPPEAAMWKQKLSGMRVAYFKSGGSTDLGGSYSWSDKRNIDLCSNDAFQSEGGFQGSLGTAGGSAIMNPGSQSQSGQWAVVGQAGQPALQLRHSTGGVETFVLSTDGSKTFLDGVRWYVVENPTCQ